MSHSWNCLQRNAIIFVNQNLGIQISGKQTNIKSSLWVLSDNTHIVSDSAHMSVWIKESSMIETKNINITFVGVILSLGRKMKQDALWYHVIPRILKKKKKYKQENSVSLKH